ncbi:MAG: TetR family transcriptional regulator C-terminal domain-containing protein [Nitratireductor sp.]|nr:TetR family transcriptional regulator C-terminal domain-containing protein [Nitratireductor sp.]
MQDEHTNIRKENTDARRAELIAATLQVIARDGVKAATVRAIASEGKVTQGLIRYYFRSKDDLIAAAYELHMSELIDAADRASSGRESARKRLARFIQVSLEPPVTSREAVAIWAGFFEILLHDDAMNASHKRSYDRLRLRLRALIADVFGEAGTPASDSRLRGLSIAGNAILDGLWLEGGALPEAFEKGELARIGLESFSALLGTDLCSLTGPDVQSARPQSPPSK